MDSKVKDLEKKLFAQAQDQVQQSLKEKLHQQNNSDSKANELQLLQKIKEIEIQLELRQNETQG